MGFRPSWTMIRAIRDLSKNIFLLCSSEFFLQRSYSSHAPQVVIIWIFWIRSIINKIEGICVCKRISFLLLRGRGQLSLFQYLPAPLSLLRLHRHPLCSSSSTGCSGLLSVPSPFAGLSGGCNITDALHGASGAAHPLWMGALLDSGQPLPQPFCSQPSLPGLPVSDTTLNLLGRGGTAAWGCHEPPWEAECWL